ncbi:MAG: hypothetical protein FJ291_05535 [Planctomycetes bacterium]|nr:hypothetical protein [Planctomycetota bacterium]
MSTATMDHRELGRRGREYYDRFLREKLEPQHKGKFLALEVETGEYELGDTTLEALDRAEAKHPDSVFCILRVGYRTAGRIGVQARRGRP